MGNKNQPLFVYGTLKPGHERWPVIRDFVTDIKPAKLQGYLVNLGAFPGLVLEGKDTISGYLLHGEFDDSFWDLVDRIEGPMYERRWVWIHNGCGIMVNTVVYVLVSAGESWHEAVDLDSEEIKEFNRQHA